MAARILLVQDQVDPMPSAEVTLKSSGYLFVEKAACEDGLSWLAGEKMDVIVLDVPFPSMSGHRVLRTLKERAISSSVLVLTGKGRNGMGDEQRISLASALKAYDISYQMNGNHPVHTDLSHEIRFEVSHAGDPAHGVPDKPREIKSITHDGRSVVAGEQGVKESTVIIDLRENHPESSYAESVKNRARRPHEHMSAQAGTTTRHQDEIVSNRREDEAGENRVEAHTIEGYPTFEEAIDKIAMAKAE